MLTFRYFVFRWVEPGLILFAEPGSVPWLRPGANPLLDRATSAADRAFRHFVRVQCPIFPYLEFARLLGD